MNFDLNNYIISFTTKNLIKAFCKSSLIDIDATFKLTKLNSNVIVIGYLGLDRKINLFSLIISNFNESDNLYNQLFSLLFNLKLSNNTDLSNVSLISDCHFSISKNFKNYFHNSNHIVCWAHVVRNLRNNFPKKVDLNNNIEISNNFNNKKNKNEKENLKNKYFYDLSFLQRAP